MNTTDKNKATVLIVDDSRVVLKILERTLLEKYQVLTATNGKEAMQMVSEHSEVKLIISDLWMPVMDGFELLAALQQSPNPIIKAIPVIVVTASQLDAPVRAKLDDLNATAVLRKPVTSAKLLGSINRIASVAQTGLETMFLVRPTLAELFPVLGADEIRANLGQFFYAGDSNKTSHCLSMFRVIEQSFTGQDTTPDIAERVYETLNSGIRDTDCFVRHANKGFLFVMAGIGRDMHRKRNAYLLKRLALKLAEDQPPFNKFFIHMCVLPFNSSRMQEDDMWELFSSAQLALNEIKSKSQSALIFEEEQQFFSADELLQRRA